MYEFVNLKFEKYTFFSGTCTWTKVGVRKNAHLVHTSTTSDPSWHLQVSGASRELNNAFPVEIQIQIQIQIQDELCFSCVTSCGCRRLHCFESPDHMWDMYKRQSPCERPCGTKGACVGQNSCHTVYICTDGASGGRH